ncbi:MAG: hypothetical protein HFJ34_04775 [Clostridia bacterium]|nr:hypothetical protein [Clostridia bacterium]
MILETKNRTIKLVLKTRKIVDISNVLKDKNFEEAFTKAYAICDLDALTKMMYILAEDENGKNIFTSSDEVYDFLDDYRKESKSTFVEIYKKIAEELNNEGFFKNKKTKEELEEMTSNPLSSINMNELMQKSTEKAMSKIAEEQFKGFKA